LSNKPVFTKPLYSTLDELRLFDDGKTAKRENEPYRTEWRKDYGRLVHSPSFRRLQGKTQLFPNNENDFYRNRITHSLEVAQIAKSIAMKINSNHFEDNNKIDLDIVELAGLAHDLGHPPFGHNGETSLDECMREINGGFEGNAQTLRIVSRLEKKATLTKDSNGEFIPILDGKDNRCGLNLTARSLAALLKYDQPIPARNKNRGAREGKVFKGYYECDTEIVEFVKTSVLGIPMTEIQDRGIKFKTIECQIMDIADDIAYSTYDLEDAFKADFLNPLKLVSFGNSFYKEIAEEIQEDLKTNYTANNYEPGDLTYTETDILVTLLSLFGQIFDTPEGEIPYDIAGKACHHSESLASNGYLRTDFTSDLVATFIDGVMFEANLEFPALSKVYLHPQIFKIVETLKKISYKSLIMSPMLKIAEYRGKDIIGKIYGVLKDDAKGGNLLLPKDYGHLYLKATEDSFRQRVICDYIAGMTDRYALEFYNRLFGTVPETIHKPF